MPTFDEALASARARVAELARDWPGQELVILEDKVQSRARGWAFPYDTRRFLETDNPLDGLVGNGPVFVDKDTGVVHVVPSGGFAAWLDEYDRTGVPPAPPRGMRWIGQGPAPPLPLSGDER